MTDAENTPAPADAGEVEISTIEKSKSSAGVPAAAGEVGVRVLAICDEIESTQEPGKRGFFAVADIRAIAAQAREAEGLRADAERFRWLAQQSWWAPGRWAPRPGDVPDTDLRAVVDAARAAETAGGSDA